MSSDLPEQRASHEDRDRVVDTLRTAVHDTAWADRAAAEAEVEASRRRLREQRSKPG